MTTSPQQTTEFLVFLPVRPAARDEFRAKLFEIGDHVAQEPEFVSCSIHEDADDPDTLVLREVWACGRDELFEQLKRPYRTRYEAELSSMLEGERRFVFLTPPIATYPA
ncbi:MAG TPA: antibiotic biosynthesis monooxygenase [Pseudonocardia sp.]|mgnify:CR=1 FL=1|uniref:putative quinol monooxygenase n=1 Tax=Pseudonocardia sp. TaxID=60912 RepID=UPI002B4B0F3B|nr:antibiotic biosynthesis monooxygenase [Pseudonocardia sp.]HLU57043.1 antibiotic biosynthesis monooxygenase [Pseudonocardia sp.]